MDSQMNSLVHSDGAGDLHFSRDGTLLATCGQDARLCVHETARALRGEERVVASFACAEPVTALALFSNGKGAKGDANSTVSCLAVSEDRLVTVYSVRDADGYISVAPVETLARLSVPAMSVTVAEQRRWRRLLLKLDDLGRRPNHPVGTRGGRHGGEGRGGVVEP